MEWKISESVLPIHGGPCDNVPHSTPLHCHRHGRLLRSKYLLYGPSVSMATDDGPMAGAEPHRTTASAPRSSDWAWTTSLGSEGKASFTEQPGLQREREVEEKRVRGPESL